MNGLFARLGDNLRHQGSNREKVKNSELDFLKNFEMQEYNRADKSAEGDQSDIWNRDFRGDEVHTDINEYYLEYGHRSE